MDAISIQISIQEKTAVFAKLSAFMREHGTSLHDFFREDGNSACTFFLQLSPREQVAAKQVADDVYDML